MDFDKDTNHFDEAMEYLYSRTNYETFITIPYEQMAVNLARVRSFLDFTGAPDRELKIIHVAGTKGKGSVCAFLAAALQRAGHKTGLFTSPHLHSILERFQVNGENIDANLFADTLLHLADKWTEFSNEADPLTFFEWSFLVAIHIFSQMGCDYVVLETGLGGRFDATNVCRPVVSVITSIAWDHMEQLGNSLDSIAMEKCGIIKEGVPVVSGVGSSLLFCDDESSEDGPHVITPNDVAMIRALIEQKAQEKRAPMRQVTGVSEPIAKMKLGLVGRHQKWNAETAWQTLCQLPEANVSFKEFNEAVAEVHLPGRLELISRVPLIILDGAHNRSSVAALCDTVTSEWPEYGKTLLFASSRGKDIQGMFAEFFPVFHTVICTESPGTVRAVPAGELAELARNHCCKFKPQIVCQSDPHVAVETWKKCASEDELLCAAGSFYLAAALY